LGDKINKFFLKSSSKLKAKADFDKVFNTASFRKHTSDFSLLVIKNNLHVNRLGIVVTKKRFKLAVTRNKLKRQVREVYRCQQNKLPGLDMVVIVNSINCNRRSLEMLITKAGNHPWQK
jgi:ribonuclease P protein component